jgi:hypothetical protein
LYTISNPSQNVIDAIPVLPSKGARVCVKVLKTRLTNVLLYYKFSNKRPWSLYGGKVALVPYHTSWNIPTPILLPNFIQKDSVLRSTGTILPVKSKFQPWVKNRNETAGQGAVGDELALSLCTTAGYCTHTTAL